MLKRNLMIIMSIITVLFLAACGNGNSESSTSGAKAGNKNTKTADKSETLVIYSNSASEGRGDWLKEKAAEEGFKLEIVEAGGGDVTNRLVAEKNNPLADVVYGLNEINYRILKKEDVLEPFTPVWADEVEPGSSDPDGYYHSIVKQAILLIYNSELYNEKTAPKDWPDLWNNKEFHGLYETPISLGGDTTRTVIAGILVRHRDENGELGISQKGWDEIAKFFKNGSPAVEGEDFYANLASGKTPMGQMFSSGINPREEQYNVKAGIVSPEIGVPYVTEQVAIIKGTKKRALAEEFINWFGSAEIQGQWAQKFGTMPTNLGAVDMAQEDVKKLHDSLVVQDMDWDFITEHINEWVEKITLDIQ